MNKEIIVSVCCVTYNHKNFIAQAIESFLMQKTTFPFEILIGEDCSTDGTRKVVFDYQARNAEVIKIITSDYNVGMLHNIIRTGAAARGKYIALCDGDDYWTDPYKLQKQVDFLEANPDVAGCFHNSINVDTNGDIIRERYFQPTQVLYNQYDAFVKLGGGYPTCSLVFRAKVIKELPKWYLKRPSDEALDLLITEYGKLAYIDENMSAYRIHPGGVWQGKGPIGHARERLYRSIIFYQHKKFRDLNRKILAKRIAGSVSILAQHSSGSIGRDFVNKVGYSYLIYKYSPAKMLSKHKTVLKIFLPPKLITYYKKLRNFVGRKCNPDT